MQDRTAKDWRNRLSGVANRRRYCGSRRLQRFAQLRAALGWETQKRYRREQQYVTQGLVKTEVYVLSFALTDLPSLGYPRWQCNADDWRGEQVKPQARPEIFCCNVNCLLTVSVCSLILVLGLICMTIYLTTVLC